MYSDAEQGRCQNSKEGKHHGSLEGGRGRCHVHCVLVLIGEDALHHEAGANGQVAEPGEKDAPKHQHPEAQRVAEAASGHDLFEIPAVTSHGEGSILDWVLGWAPQKKVFILCWWNLK